MITDGKSIYYSIDPGGEGFEGNTVLEAIDAWEEEFGAYGDWDHILVFKFKASNSDEKRPTELGHYSGNDRHNLKFTADKL